LSSADESSGSRESQLSGNTRSVSSGNGLRRIECVKNTREIAIAREQLDDHVALCTKRYGYDPKVDSKLGPSGLAPREREWGECVYQGIEEYLIPRTLSPGIYRQAIAEDRKLTEASKVQMDRLEMETRQDMMQRGLGPLRR